MQLSFDVRIPDGLLAANALLNEKPHQGVPSWNLALHQGIDERNSTAAIGIRASAQLNRIWPRFTGKERDTESGLDYFGARYYASSMGRWMSPDYDDDNDEIEPVPYANPENPQTLNLYSYVVNNPLSKTDATGHTHQECGAQTTTTDAKTGATTVNANCHDVPDWYNFIDRFMNFRQKFKDNVNANYEAHKLPQQPNNKGQALQDLNNIMMGAVPLVGVGLVPKAQATLDSIDKTGQAPPGQQGGRQFMNNEGNLPSTDANGNPIKYQEWDVNPKQPGVNRGGERLVTGSDGSAYTTADHYQTFTKIR